MDLGARRRHGPRRAIERGQRQAENRPSIDELRMAPRPGARSRSPVTVRRRVTRMGTAALVLLVVLIGLGVACLIVSEANGVNANHGSRATIATQKVMVAMEDQGAGLWGYASTRQPGYLALYLQGRALTGQAMAQLVDETKGTSDAARVGRVSADIQGWQQWAEGVREQAASGGTVDPAALSTAESDLFDPFQSDVADLLR